MKDRIAILGAIFLCAALVAGCKSEGDSSDNCRFYPEDCSDGRAGAFCDRNSDCRDVCCTDDTNCAGGMCTFTCRDDRDCPFDMGCEHDVCFYLCDFDEDCAVGQTCEHDNTVCEWN